MRLFEMILATFAVAGLAGLAFPYLGYPLLLRLIPARRPNEPVGEPPPAPGVSVIVAAYNEAGRIAGKIDDILAQDYDGPLEIIVASDASDDGMDDVARRYEDRGVLLVRLPERGGKSVAQNAAVEIARGEVLLFTDASVTLAPGTIKALIERLADPTVGCVTGEDASIAASAGDASAGAGLYTRFEKAVRRLEEENTGTLIGVSGCLFAVRRELRPPVPPQAVDDLFVPIHVTCRGYRVVAEKGAVAYVRRTNGLAQEFSRKVRTFTGAFFTMPAIRRTEDPVALARIRPHLFAHKYARWLGPAFALMALAGSGLLAPRHPLFALVFALQAAGYAGGLIGLFALARSARGEDAGTPGLIARITRLAAFFLVVQAAAAFAWWRYFAGKPFVVWTPTKRAA
ncbi:glycosyltransferase [bacterium]|nr:glycosyltransferase [bacterium]